jgi:hypothetical protein
LGEEERGFDFFTEEYWWGRMTRISLERDNFYIQKG